jgi:hypothetical protein
MLAAVIVHARRASGPCRARWSPVRLGDLPLTLPSPRKRAEGADILRLGQLPRKSSINPTAFSAAPLAAGGDGVAGVEEEDHRMLARSSRRKGMVSDPPGYLPRPAGGERAGVRGGFWSSDRSL